MVVGFDLGGKYTEKDDEKSNKKLCDFLASIDAERINNLLLEETIKYLAARPDYYPYVLATVHGGLQSDYAACVDYILNLIELVIWVRIRFIKPSLVAKIWKCKNIKNACICRDSC